MKTRKLTPEEKKKIAEKINLLAGEEAIYTVDDSLTLIISGKHKYVRKKDLEKIGKYKIYIAGVDIEDDVKWIEPDTFEGFENISEIDATERLLANISIKDVFGGTNLDLKGMEKIAHEYLYGGRSEMEKDEPEIDISDLR